MTENANSRSRVRLRGLKTRIFAISFSVCLITVMIVAALSLAGESPAVSIPTCSNNVPSIMQCGTVTFTITATTFNTQTISFTPAFSSVPGSFKLDIPNPAAWPSVSLTVPASLIDYCFICRGNTGQSFTWTNMPAATTEIFGDVNREHQISGTSPFTTSTISGVFRAAVDCNTGSTSANAVLEIQWSSDDVTWNDLANTAGQGDIPIDAAVNCPTAGTIVLAFGGNGVSINTAFVGSANKVYYRVVGKNGNGIGDVPAFSWLELSIRTVSTTLIDPCVLDQPTALSASSVQVRLRCFASTSVTTTFRWKAQL